MIVFAHTKFGLVQIQGSKVKRGGAESIPRPQRVFEIPVRIGLSNFVALKSVFWMVINTLW